MTPGAISRGTGREASGPWQAQEVAATACPRCGFDPSGVTPADAAVAVRSFPRRFRELLDDAEREEAGRATNAGTDGWSAADHAAAAADGLATVAPLLRQVAVSDDPALALPVVDGATPSGASVDAALTGLQRASDSLATEIDAVKGRDWERTGHNGGRQAWTALDVARLGVHLGVHHIRAAARTLGA